MPVTSFGGSDVGVQRKENQDSILVDDDLNLYVVADGMGGHKGGEIASAMCIQVILREIQARIAKIREALGSGTVEARKTARTEVSQAIVTACKEVYAHAQTDEKIRGMGTTVAMLLVVGHEGIVAHAGDSRVYMLREGKCNQLTEDHTMLQEHLKAGLITPEEAKTANYGNVISRSVGVHPTVKPDTLNVELMTGDEFLICSDGLHGYIEDGELGSLIEGMDKMEVVKNLIDYANLKGGKDNVSVIDIRVVPAPTAAASPEPEAAEEPGSTASDKLKALHSIPLFRYLDYKELVTIMTIIAVRPYGAGQVVVTEGEPGDELFVVLTGAVDVKKGDKVLVTLKRMKHFGEMALLDNEPRSATVVAVEPSKLMVIARKEFLSLLQREPSMGVKLLWSVVQVLSHRMRETLAQVNKEKKD